MDLMGKIDKKSAKANVPTFDVGDSVDVEVKIKEGDKERIQVFSGVVIAMKGSGIKRTFTVRRIVQSEGVERVFPFHSPRIAGVTVKRQGRIRRSKLYYLRDRAGKSARIAERRRVLEASAEPTAKD